MNCGREAAGETQTMQRHIGATPTPMTSVLHVVSFAERIINCIFVYAKMQATAGQS
jgi:hypothetical protein